jgi:hypothetical protein
MRIGGARAGGGGPARVGRCEAQLERLEVLSEPGPQRPPKMIRNALLAPRGFLDITTSSAQAVIQPFTHC